MPPCDACDRPFSPIGLTTQESRSTLKEASACSGESTRTACFDMRTACARVAWRGGTMPPAPNARHVCVIVSGHLCQGGCSCPVTCPAALLLLSLLPSWPPAPVPVCSITSVAASQAVLRSQHVASPSQRAVQSSQLVVPSLCVPLSRPAVLLSRPAVPLRHAARRTHASRIVIVAAATSTAAAVLSRRTRRFCT